MINWRLLAKADYGAMAHARAQLRGMAFDDLGEIAQVGCCGVEADDQLAHRVDRLGLGRRCDSFGNGFDWRTFENSDKLDILVTLVEKCEETRWPIQSPANADRHCKILDRAF